MPLRYTESDRDADSYDSLFAEIDDECRAEHEAEFDFPYVSDGKRVHRLVMQTASARRDEASI